MIATQLQLFEDFEQLPDGDDPLDSELVETDDLREIETPSLKYAA
jgi:hypothetical protein